LCDGGHFAIAANRYGAINDGPQGSLMSKIRQTAQTGFARILADFAHSIDLDRRDTFSSTEWRPSRWPETDVSSRGL